MDDLREEILRSVHRRLPSREFADRLTLRGEDGMTPVVVVLSTDPVRRLLDEVLAMGGASNVVAHILDGLMIFAMETTTVPAKDSPPDQLSAECTVGVLLAHLIEQGGGKQTYTFRTRGETTCGSAAGASLVGAK